jgi:ABC-type branched-subunit amino acid transport system substrate-binding protein
MSNGPAPRAHRPLTISAAVFAAGALALAGCGGSSKAATSAGGSTGGVLKSAPGFDAGTGTFTVAALEPLSGPLSSAGLPIVGGMKVYFDQLKAKGGIAGKYQVTFDPEDTQFNPQVTVPLYNRLKGGTAMFAGILGTTIVKTLVPQMAADNVTSVVDSSSASDVHAQNQLSWGTPTQINMINLAAYAAGTLQKKNSTFCSVTTGDDLGADNRQGIQFAVQKLGLRFKTDAVVEQTETDFTPQVQKLKSSGCQVVMFGATAAQLPGVIAASVQLGFDAQFMGQNNIYVPAFAKSAIAPYLEKHLLTTIVGVDWNSGAPGQAALRAGIAQYDKSIAPSPYAELGYAHAMFVAAVLNQAVKDGDVSRAGILKASRSIGSFDYQGILPPYVYAAPADRKPSLSTGIYRIDPSVPMGLSPVVPAYQSALASQYPIAS